MKTKHADNHIQQLTAVHSAAKHLRRLGRPSAMAQEVIRLLETSLAYEYAAVLLVDAETSGLVPYALSDQGKGPAFIEHDKRYVWSHGLRVGDGVTGWVAEHGDSVLLGDVRLDPRYHAMRDDIRSELCVPIESAEETIGVLNIETSQPDAYDQSDQLVLETVAAQFAVARLAVTDPLTGIANRGCFIAAADDAIRSARRTGEALAVLVLDLDRLKAVNDSCGHQHGDRALRALAQVASNAAGGPDSVGRIGGDEFAVVLCGSNASRALDIRQSIVSGVAELEIGPADAQVPIAVSIGIAFLGPQHRTIDDLLSDADAAMYRHKRRECVPGETKRVPGFRNLESRTMEGVSPTF